MELCGQAANEENPERLLKLIDEINQLLEKRAKNPSQSCNQPASVS